MLSDGKIEVETEFLSKMELNVLQMIVKEISEKAFIFYTYLPFPSLVTKICWNSSVPSIPVVDRFT